ncbi:hypothetical protein [Photobacterium sp. BZF1]
MITSTPAISVSCNQFN